MAVTYTIKTEVTGFSSWDIDILCSISVCSRLKKGLLLSLEIIEKVELVRRKMELWLEGIEPSTSLFFVLFFFYVRKEINWRKELGNDRSNENRYCFYSLSFFFIKGCKKVLKKRIIPFRERFLGCYLLEKCLQLFWKWIFSIDSGPIRASYLNISG